MEGGASLAYCLLPVGYGRQSSVAAQGVADRGWSWVPGYGRDSGRRVRDGVGWGRGASGAGAETPGGGTGSGGGGGGGAGGTVAGGGGGGGLGGGGGGRGASTCVHRLPDGTLPALIHRAAGHRCPTVRQFHFDSAKWGIPVKSSPSSWCALLVIKSAARGPRCTTGREDR